MIRNCENEKYTHSMTSASVSLPRSCRCRGVRIPLIGGYFDRVTRMVMRNAMAVSAWLTMKSNPHMVEYQVGSKDMTQSCAMKVTTSAWTTMPGPATQDILPW